MPICKKVGIFLSVSKGLNGSNLAAFAAGKIPEINLKIQSETPEKSITMVQ